MEPTNQGEVAKQADKLSHVIQIDEGKIQAYLGEVVRSTVEETLNAATWISKIPSACTVPLAM